MVQGVNKEFIFNDDEKIKRYLRLIKKNIIDDSFSLISYCIMNNHAHFLFWVNDIEAFGKYMHNNNLIYAQTYNLERKRCGVVFRNKYKIEPIYDKDHLINCIRYIHNNPVKAGMVRDCKDYKYSSYLDYANNIGIARNEILRNLFGDNFNALIKHHNESDGSAKMFMDIDNVIITDSYITSGISDFLKVNNYHLIQIFEERKITRKMLFFLKDNWHIPYKNTADFMGISRGVLNCILKKEF